MVVVLFSKWIPEMVVVLLMSSCRSCSSCPSRGYLEKNFQDMVRGSSAPNNRGVWGLLSKEGRNGGVGVGGALLKVFLLLSSRGVVHTTCRRGWVPLNHVVLDHFLIDIIVGSW